MENASSYHLYQSLHKKLTDLRENSQLDEATNRINYYSKITEDYLNNIQYIQEKEENSSDLDRFEKGFESTFLYDGIRERLVEYDKLKKDLKNPFKVFIMGSGSYGKSTLINSLLGGNYAESDQLPKTWKIDFYEKSDDSNRIELHYKQERRIQNVTKRRAIEKIEEEENKVAKSELVIREKKREIRKKYKDLTYDEQMEYDKKIENEYNYLPAINEVHWGIEDAEILDDIILVDTPGLNQELNKIAYSGNVVEDVESFSNQSDGVIWMLDATTIDQAITKSTFSKINSDNVIAVVNKIDKVESPELVMKRAHELYGDIFKHIIPYSALEVYNAQKDNDLVRKNQAGYADLMDAINNSYLRNASTIQANRVNDSCFKYNIQTIKQVTEYNELLLKNYYQVVEGKEKIFKLLSERQGSLRVEFYRVLTNEYNKMKVNLTSHLEAVAEMESEQERESYINRHILQKSKILSLQKNYLQRANQYADQQYTSILQDYLVTQYKLLNNYRELPDLPQAELAANISTSSIHMPSVFNASAIGGGIGAIFGPVGAIIGAGIGGWFSSSMRNDSIREVEDSIFSSYQELSNDYNQATYDYYMDILNEVELLLEDSFANIYNLTPYIDVYELGELVDHISTWNQHLTAQLKDENTKFFASVPELILQKDKNKER